MNKNCWLLLLLSIGLAGTVLHFKLGHKMTYKVNNSKDLVNVFPKSVDQINKNVDKCIQDIEKHINTILSHRGNRTFENTAKALDMVSYYITPVHASLTAIEFLSPDKDLRDAAHAGILKLNGFLVDKVTTNVDLYKAFKDYVENQSSKDNLNPEQKYFIEQTMADYKRSGLDLPEDKLTTVRTLAKELANLAVTFESNISQHTCKIEVSLNDLKGLDQSFINCLPKTDSGNYILGCDYPTYFNVMENCQVESTRFKLYKDFQNRAYPVNMEILNQVIAKRDQMAKLVGYDSYADLSLDNQMASSISRVEEFLFKLFDKSEFKAGQEVKTLKGDLPEPVTLDDNKIKPWDLLFVKNQYKKKHLSIDEQKIAEYFPMEHTVQQLLSIYEQFLGLKFVEIKNNNFWHPDVKLIEAYDAQTNKLLGYLLLDLYPRENKFSHAANLTVIPSVKDQQGRTLSVSVVMANFPKPTECKPSLLKFKDVITFFHEFGHAIHVLLGCTELYSFAGTNVKTDFVELPSQMLEDWMHDKGILKFVSKHYITNEPLSDELIEKIIKLEQFDSGISTLQQIYYALLSLEYFKEGANKDTQAISKNLYNKVLKHLPWSPENHFQASFGHLMGYGASYYGYLWSRVYAKDLFHEIKKEGLLNPKVGKKYIKEVIGQGGSQDPNNLLKNFLGREPNEKAFLRDLGLN